MRRLSDRELKEPRFGPVPRSRQQQEKAAAGEEADTVPTRVLPEARAQDMDAPTAAAAADARPEPASDTNLVDVSPGDIIARAASTVRDDRDTREIRALFAPEPEPEEEEEPCAPLPMARPNHRARRRVQLTVSRLRRTARALRYAPLVAVAIGVPAWLWQAGHVEAARNYLARQVNAAATGVTDALDLRVAGMHIAGAEMTGTRPIGEALAIEPGASILSLDLDAARARIAALPWVKQVEIQRRLPGRLHIRVVERTPVARLRRTDRVSLIDTGGVEIDTNVRKDRRFAHLPILSGDRAADAAPALMTLLARHPKYGRRVIAAHYQGRRRWDVKFDTGVVLMLPEKHAAESWDRFVLYAARYGLLSRRARYIDMRLHDRMVIRLEKPEAPKAPSKKRRRQGRNG